MRPAHRILTDVIILSALLVACDTDDGTNSQSADSGPSAFGQTACGLCVQTTCASQAASCNATPDCASWLSCTYACPSNAAGDVDPACEAACPAAASTPGAAAQQEFVACHQGPARQTCDTCGAASCDGCTEAKCSAQKAACDQNALCEMAGACNSQCESAANCEACLTIDTQASRAYLELAACRIADCGIACGTGEEACLSSDCRDAYLACESDLRCHLLFRCYVFCENASACQSACEAKESTEVQSKFQAFVSCIAAKCLNG